MELVKRRGVKRRRAILKQRNMHAEGEREKGRGKKDRIQLGMVRKDDGRAMHVRVCVIERTLQFGGVCFRSLGRD